MKKEKVIEKIQSLKEPYILNNLGHEAAQYFEEFLFQHLDNLSMNALNELYQTMKEGSEDN